MPETLGAHNQEPRPSNSGRSRLSVDSAPLVASGFWRAGRLANTQTGFLTPCGQDTELRHDVESLLAHRTQAADFLEPPERKVTETMLTGGQFGAYRDPSDTVIVLETAR
jgi:hypothetical protein